MQNHFVFPTLILYERESNEVHAKNKNQKSREESTFSSFSFGISFPFSASHFMLNISSKLYGNIKFEYFNSDNFFHLAGKSLVFFMNFGLMIIEYPRVYMLSSPSISMLWISLVWFADHETKREKFHALQFLQDE